MKISIPVSRELHSPVMPEHAVVLAAGTAFLLGALVALVAVSATLPPANGAHDDVLASIGALGHARSPFDLPASEFEGEVSGAAVETVSTETPPLPEDDAARPRSRAELDLLIADREIALFRITGELEHVKRESINTTAAFTQNCNNWGDYCAGPYKERLDALNAEYARLSALLAELSNELDALVAERG